MADQGDEIATGTGSGGRLPECHADREHREQVIRTLRAALVQGRLTDDECDARTAQASATRSHAVLTALTADLPVGRMDAPARSPKASDVRAGVGVIIAAVSVLAAILVWHPDNFLAFSMAILAAAVLIVTPVITVGLMVDVRHQKRSGGQLPRKSTPGPTGNIGS